MIRAGIVVIGLILASTARGRPEDSVVRLLIAKRPVDVTSPWQFERVVQRQHLGTVVTGGKILTTAYAVRDASQVEIQIFGSTTKHPAQVAFVDWEINLALVEPKDSAVLRSLSPLPLGGDLAIGQEVTLYKPRDGHQLTAFPGRFLEVGVFSATTSAYTAAAYLVKVQQTGLGWSEPVVKDGRLVALSTGQDSNFVHALPASIIRHFLEDAHGPGYKGFPAMGIKLAALTSPDMRHLLKASDEKGGVRVARVYEGSSFAGVLFQDDVLLEVDGKPLNEHGYFKHPLWGEVHLKYILNTKYAGDTLSAVISRRGKRQSVTATLKRSLSNEALVPEYSSDGDARHLIFGGLVFQELTKPYLEQWGSDWKDLAPFDLLYTYEYENEPQPDEKRRIIVLGRVLPDEFNRGYEKHRHMQVDTVNGVKVESLDDLERALREKPIARHGRRFARIVFRRDGGEIILAYDGLAEAHARIARTYGVHSPESFYR